MSVETDFDLEAMTEIWNSWGEMFRQKDLELQKLKKNLPKDNSAGWYGGCEVDFKNLLEENEKLKEKIGYDEAEIEKLMMWNHERIQLKEEKEKLKENCDNLNDAAMEACHDYEVLSDKFANERAIFQEIIGGLEEQIEQLEKPKPKKTITCSSCGQEGHNKASKKCPNVIDA